MAITKIPKTLVFLFLIMQLNLYFLNFSDIRDSVILNIVFLFIMAITFILIFLKLHINFTKTEIECVISLFKKEIFIKKIVQNDINKIELSQKSIKLYKKNSSVVKIKDYSLQTKNNIINFAVNNNIPYK